MALSYLDFDGRSSGSDVQTYTGLSIGTASADRWVLLGIFASRQGSTAETVSTSAGTPTAMGTEAVEGARTVRFYKINVTSGTTLDVTITANTGGGAAFFETAVAVWVESAGEPTLTDQDQATLISGTMSCSVNVSSGGAVLGWTSTGFNSGAITWVGATQDFRDTLVANLSGASEDALSVQTGRTVSASVSGDAFENILKVISYEVTTAGENTLLAQSIRSLSTVSVPTVAQTQVLDARNLNSASTVSSPSIAVTSILLSEGVQSVSALSVPTVQATSVLLSQGVQSVSTLSRPTVTESQNSETLDATNIQSLSQVNGPSLSQEHTLLAGSLQSLSTLSRPAASLTTDQLTVQSIRSLTSVGSPSLTQVHNLQDRGMESLSTTTSAIFSSPIDLLATSIVSRSEVQRPRLVLQSPPVQNFKRTVYINKDYRTRTIRGGRG